jgi:hypothetical protein
MPGVRRDGGAGGKRRRIGEVELVAVRVRDDHEPVAPLPVLHIHAAPFQLSTQGIQHTGIALGVPRNSVLRLMRLDGLWPAAVGLVIGMLVGALAVRLIRTVLYGTNLLDWTLFA